MLNKRNSGGTCKNSLGHKKDNHYGNAEFGRYVCVFVNAFMLLNSHHRNDHIDIQFNDLFILLFDKKR